MFVADLFKSRTRPEAENLFLRHQLTIALRQAPPRLRLRGSDRALLLWMTQLWPSLLGAALGFKAFWRWKSRNRAGRPKIDRGLRDLIQRMSKENPLWAHRGSIATLALGYHQYVRIRFSERTAVAAHAAGRSIFSGSEQKFRDEDD
jgi:hypothetical protein